MADHATPAEAPPAPEPTAAAPEPEVAAPEVPAEPEVAAPEVPAEPEIPAAAAELEVAAPAAEPEVVAPAVEPEATAVVAVPEAAPKDPAETSAMMHKPKYDPMLAHNVRRPLSYSRTVIADQELLLSNLSRMRRDLDKEERELRIMAKTLFNHNAKKWTPPNSNRNEANLRGGYALIKICKMFQDY